jgi:sulfofructose kinase
VRWPVASRAVIARAQALGKPTVLDADLTSDPAALAALVPMASHVVFSEPALAQFAGEDGSVEDRLRRVHDAGAHVLVGVTMGEQGASWVDASGFQHEPAVSIRAVDTLAAGDVFHGAFAFGLTEGWEMDATIRFAAAAAAIKCTRFGGRLGAPARAEVEAFLTQA